MSWKKKLVTGATLVGAATVGIHIINKLIYFSATIDDLLSDSSETYYEWRFGKIYYTKQGKGKPILLIHDFTTHSSSYEWNKVINGLAETNTVYCIDLLGCGRSDKPNLTYTNFLYVQLITDFIKHIIGEKTDVIATGESGSFVLAGCQNDESIIDQILLVNPADMNLLSKIPTKRSKLLSRFIHTPVFGTFLYNMLNRKKEIRTLFELDYFQNADNVSEETINSYYEYAHSGDASSKYLFASMAGCYTTISVAHCLRPLANSIYILTGEGNPNNTVFAKEYKDILPSIELVSIPNAKHLPQLELPEEFIEQAKLLLGEER